MSITTTIKVGELPKTITLPEGKALTIKPNAGSSGTAGVAYLLDQALGGTNSKATWQIGPAPLAPIGPYESTQRILISCSSGSIDATVVDAAPVLAQQAVSLAPRVGRSNIMEDQVYAAVGAQAQTANNFTYHMTIVLPTDCTQFRVALDNVSLTLPFRIKSAVIATSDSVGPDPAFGATANQVRFTPQNGTAWKSLTWDSGQASVEIAVAPGAGRKTRKWSDWIDAPTVANTDGSKLRVVMIRFYVEGTTASPGNGYCTGSYPLTWRTLAANQGLHKGFLWQCIRYSGDGVTTPASFQPTTDLSTLPFLTALQYKTRAPGIVINGVGGDSQLAGAVNAGGGNFGNGWLFQLVNMLRDRYPYIPFSLSNNGWPSTGSATYGQLALDYLNAGAVIGLPIYMVGTQNDGAPSAGFTAAAWARAATACGVLQGQGKTVALMTPMPNSSLGWTAAQDAFRLALRQEILDIAAAGGTVALDMEVVSNGAVPARYVSAYTTDAAHPNEAGHAAIAAAAFPEACKMIG